MGFDVNGARFLLDAGRNGVKFDCCATIGRQEMHLSPQQLLGLFLKAGIAVDHATSMQILENDGEKGYAEEFLRQCGAKEVVSIDYSSYEKASFAHDMNQPIPAEYENRFDCVIDGGTLEHVFNVPVAFSNCMRMVKVGGHFLAIAPCNNFMGHGFYQFSPELFYGIFAEKNGYQVERMFIFEVGENACWYAVANPATLGRRVELANRLPAYLLVQAKKVSLQDLHDITPQQSDYIALWREDGVGDGVDHGDRSAVDSSLLGRRLQKILRFLPLERFNTPFQPPFYTRYK